jgi:hypothetical protein
MVLIVVLTGRAGLACAFMGIFIVHLDNLLSVRNGLQSYYFQKFQKYA